MPKAGMMHDKRVIFRIGDVIIAGDNILEDGINIAARIEALAKPGGIAVSGQAHEGVRDCLDVAFLYTREQTLKISPARFGSGIGCRAQTWGHPLRPDTRF